MYKSQYIKRPFLVLQIFFRRLGVGAAGDVYKRQFLDGVIAVFPNFTGLYDVLSYIPLFTDGFGWVIPSLAMGVIRGIVDRGKPRNYCPKTEERLAL